MEQHPIPQQISSYQFKLVGDMTLKQFFQVAGGVIVSLIFYSTPLHPIIKWPLILISAGLGVALAFLPFEERPLERWIIAFFRSIYSPTLYYWRKTDKPPIFYTENAPAPAITTVVSTNNVGQKDASKLEEAEKSFLQKVGGLFSINSQPPTTNTQVLVSAKTEPVSATTSDVSIPAQNTNTDQNIQNQGNVTIFNPQTNLSNHTQTASVKSAPTLTVPQQIPTVITKNTPKFVVEETVQPANNHPAVEVAIEKPKLPDSAPITTNVVEFSVDAAPPSPPIAINTITGQVMDNDRKIIEGAILEIRDSNGKPVRALKSNKAGHFIIVTPLQNGKYEITIDKDGFKFEPVSFEAKGDMIPAIAISGARVA